MLETRIRGGGGGAAGISLPLLSGTVGSVLFVGAGPVISQNNANFFWDNTNNRLGIGTAVPTSTFHVVAPATDVLPVKITNAAYTGTANFDAVNCTTTTAPASSALGINMRGLVFSATHNHPIVDGSYTQVTTGMVATARDNSAYSGTVGTSTTKVIGFAMTGNNSANITNVSTAMNAETYGMQLTSSCNVQLNNASGKYVTNTYGADISVSNSSLVTAFSTLTQNFFGVRVTVAGESSGTSNAYGLRLASVAGAGTNWGIVIDNNIPNVFIGSLSLGNTSITAPTAQLDVLPKTASTIGVIVKAKVSQTANLLELRNSSDGILSSSDQTGIMTLGLAGTQTGTLKFNGTTSGTVTLLPAAVAGTWTFTLPTTPGTNSYVLQTDGTGITSWVAAGGVAGSNTQVQFNDSGAFGASAQFVFDKTTGKVTLAPTARTSGSPNILVLTGSADTTLAALTEAPDVNFNLARTVQFSTGNLTIQRAVLFQPPTYGFVGVSTLTDAATLAVSGAPVKGTNATVTNTHGLLIQAGAVSTATNSYGMTVRAQTGATNNYAAQFSGGNVGVGTASPLTTLSVNGGVSVGTVSKSAAYTATSSDFQILGSPDAAGFTVTLPTAANTGQIILVVKVNAGIGALTVAPAGAETINGGGSQAITTQYGRVTLIADGGTNWTTFGGISL